MGDTRARSKMFTSRLLLLVASDVSVDAGVVSPNWRQGTEHRSSSGVLFSTAQKAAALDMVWLLQ